MTHPVIPFRRPNRAERRRRERALSTRPRGLATPGAARPDLPPDPWEQVTRNIARHGLHLVHVGEGCDCPDCTEAPLPPEERFGYSVGLTEHGHPELLVRGLGARDTVTLLNRWGGAVLGGDRFEPGHLLCEGPGAQRWELVPVDAREVLWAAEYYRHPVYGPVRALELVPTDRRCPCAEH